MNSISRIIFFLRLAETNGTTVEMVEGNEKFTAMQGVGGLLRYKLENGNLAKNAVTSAF